MEHLTPDQCKEINQLLAVECGWVRLPVDLSGCEHSDRQGIGWSEPWQDPSGKKALFGPNYFSVNDFRSTQELITTLQRHGWEVNIYANPSVERMLKPMQVSVTLTNHCADGSGEYEEVVNSFADMALALAFTAAKALGVKISTAFGSLP